MAVCHICSEELPKREPGYITFHRCPGPPPTFEDIKIERLARAMVEGSTEYDWEELPNYLQSQIKGAAKSLYHHIDSQSIMGEVVVEQRELQPWVQKELDQIMKDNQ